MSSPAPQKTVHRLLVIDDNEAIHDDFRKILGPASAAVADISAAEAALFGEEVREIAGPGYEIDCASQGEEGLELVRQALAAGRPYALAFVDVRMPPGWDGIETLSRIWQVDADLQAVICTAYSDYSWEEMVRKLGRTDRLLILKKPFDNVEVHQLACSLTEKWNLLRSNRLNLDNLETRIFEHTRDLDRSLSLTQATLDSSADGILVVNPEGGIVGFNKKFLSLWNLNPAAVDRQPLEKVLGEVGWQIKEADAFQNKFRELAGLPEAASYDIVEFVDGRIYERYSQPQRLGEDIAGRVWSFRDITERRKAERKILEQASLLDLAQDAIVVRDLGHWVTFWNKGAERLLGWTTEESMGRQVTEFIFPDEEAFERCQQAVLEKGEWSGELEIPTKSGGKVTVSSRWNLVRDEAGHPKSVLEISTDITERKKMESRFLRTQRMESIGSMASGVAHDLNNILSPIMMSAPLLRVDLPETEREKLINNIEISANRGAAIVKQLLAFGRGMEGQRAVVQLRHLAEEIGKITRETFPRNITITSEVARDLWPIMGDATHMHQVLLNLCINARDAMPDGGAIMLTAGNLTVDDHYANLDPEARPGPYIVLGVTDTGTGIPAAIMEKIFDPFFTTKEHGKGTGLGLATVMSIARGHGGFVHVSSEVGRGTTFKIYLPASPNAQDGHTQTRTRLIKGRGETILVVDDEEGILNATTKLLESNGYQVLTSTDGVDALAIYAQHKDKIKLVLTDVMMPVMDGAAMMRVLKRLEPGIKVIATSGLEQDPRFDELRTLGIKAFLPKPYNAEKLLTTLREALDSPGDAKPA